MTTTEAARILGVTERRIRAMCKAKVLKARKLGRDWSIQADSVEQAKGRKPGRKAGGER